MYQFKASLEIIGVNPFVFVPPAILQELFLEAGKDKGYIPVKVKMDGKEHPQTLVRFMGEWRLYINTTMLKKSPERIGESLNLQICYDPSDRTIHPHPKLLEALEQDQTAMQVFDSLSPSRKKEIVRYIASLKNSESIEKNIRRAIGFLKGQNSFAGRNKP